MATPAASPPIATTAPGEAGPWLGTLWLDDPRRDPGEVIRILGLSLQAASSAAAVAYADRRFAALDEAIRAMTSLLAVDRVLQAIVDRARELIGSRYAALGISDVDGTIEQFITSGMSRTERAMVGAPPHGRGVLGAIMREAQTIRLADVASDPRRVGFPANHPVMHAFLGVPVRVRGRVIGNLYLAEKEGGFTDEDVRVVEAFAGHAGIAMENARLHEQVQRLAVVEERERIGRDLHDGIIQAIYAVGLSLEDVPEMLDGEPDEARRRVERAIDSLDQTIRDIRNFIFGLRPQLLEGVRLVEGLDALADEFRVNTMIDIDLRVGPDARDVAISPTRTLELLAIVREGLSNVARHARATQATITVLPEVDGPGLVLELADNGVGFDPAAARSGSHQGLRNIRGRAAAIEAELDIDSRVGAGARIIVRVPPDRAEEAPGEDGRGGAHRVAGAVRQGRCSVRRSGGARATRRIKPPMTEQSEPRPLRLLVVDDHEVVRQGLVALLERRERFQVVAEAGSVEEALDAARRFRPDLVVMDVRLPDGSGIEACREIRAELPGTRVVMLTSYPDEEAVLSAIIAGASGYLLKQIRARDLVSALESVGRGESLLDPAVTEKVLERVRRIASGTYTDELAQLTAQEQKILQLVAEGKTNKEIASEVFLSDKTVKNYVSSILSKLNLQRRAQAAAFVAKHRLPGSGT